MATESHLIRSVDELSQLGARSTLSPNRSPIPHNHRRRGLPHQNNHVPDVEDDHDPNKKLDQDVDFSGMSLHQLPDTPINLAAISKLDLSNNNLEVIPESLIARMLNLVEMDVHSNQLTNLPNSIGCLSKLLVLNVSANELHSLPRTIENCRSLEELNANFNNLTALPETIGFELINLKKLSVNSNKIAFLPYSTSHLTALRILDVRLNCLKALPDDLENLTSLQVLNVSQNFHHLSNLPDSIGLLLSLLELDASYNKIATLPPSISCLQKLQKLCVEGNPLVSPPMDVVELGLHSVRNYLTDKMNCAPETKQKKNKSWFGRLKKHGTSNARGSSRGVPHNHVFDVRHKEGTTNFLRKNPIEAIASPRYLSNMLSPSRWFSSPQHSFSKLS